MYPALVPLLPATLPIYLSSEVLSAGALATPMWRDKALDGEGDLLQTDNDQAWLSGVDAIGPDIVARLQTFLGEWYANVLLGVPWWEEILGAKPRKARIAALIREQVLATPGVVDCVDLLVDFVGSTRQLTISFKAVGELGALIAVTGAQVQEA